MNTLCCPKLEQLGRELIEAYRRVEDRDVFCFSEERESPSEVATLHCLIKDHRESCPLCLEIERSERAKAEGIGEQVSSM